MTQTSLYRVATVLSATAAAGAGTAYLGKNRAMMDSFEKLGYPRYFPSILGAWKLLGATALVAPGLPRLKEWAYAGLTFTYTGAFISHLASNERKESISPLLALAFLIASYSTRPPERRVR